MDDITYSPIGTIHSPFKDIEGMPIQPAGAKNVEGTVELNPELAAGLKDLEGFSHVILLYHFHRSKGYSLDVVPFLDNTPRGVFATRAPRRPNPIGLSVVRLKRISGNTLHVQDVDVLDGTPLLDLKPFVPKFDNRETERVGWLSDKADNADLMKADRRFAE